MADEILKALLAPANMVMVSTRWPNGHWQIRNLSIGSKELYPQLGYADKHLKQIQAMCDDEIQTGAVASEAAILRASFQEIEFICGGKR